MNEVKRKLTDDDDDDDDDDDIQEVTESSLAQCGEQATSDKPTYSYICCTNSGRALDSGVLILPPSEDRQQ
jgi:hypothetical protein